MKKVLAAAVLSTFSFFAMAADQGGYLAVDFGSATLTGVDFGGFNGKTVFPNPGSLHLGGGYHFNENLGVEGGIVVVGDSIINSQLLFLTATETLKTSAIYAAAVGTLPVTPELDLFGKAGLASLKVDYTATSNFGFSSTSSASKTNLMLALGGQYNFNRNWGLRVQYENFGKADFPANFFPGRTISVGLSTFTVGGVYSF